MALLGYAAVAHIVIKLVPGIEDLEISCEHVHVAIEEAAGCAMLQNRNLPGYPYWCARRLEEAESGEVHYAKLDSPDEIEAYRDANMALLFAHVAPARDQPRLFALRHNILGSLHKTD
jgi:hypothetical protein